MPAIVSPFFEISSQRLRNLWVRVDKLIDTCGTADNIDMAALYLLAQHATQPRAGSNARELGLLGQVPAFLDGTSIDAHRVLTEVMAAEPRKCGHRVHLLFEWLKNYHEDFDFRVQKDRSDRYTGVVGQMGSMREDFVQFGDIERIQQRPLALHRSGRLRC